MPQLFYIASYVNGFTIRTRRMPYPGETLMGSGFNFGPGGKGFNQAVASARLGAEVGLVMAVGEDFFGEYALETLLKENIQDPVTMKCADKPTAAGLVTLTEDGENSILLDTGANDALTTSAIEDCAERIAEADWTISQLEVPIECTQRAFELARAAGKRTLLNPAPARALPEGVLKLCDVLTPNETECRILLGLEPDDPTPTEQLAFKLLEFGVSSIVITLGSKGALCVTPDDIVKIDAVPVTPVDTTGAGDTFNAALTVGLLEGKSLTESAQFAAYAGAFSTQFMGVIDGLPTREILKNFINENQPTTQI